MSWDEYLMTIAVVSSCKSKDPNTKVGACIVDTKNRIVGTGYNGFPTGAKGKYLNWNRNGNFLDTKYPFVVHAELNAILNSTTDLTGCRMYVKLFPCNECAKAIIQSGIKEVIYLSDKYKGSDANIAAKMMFEDCGIKTREYIIRGENNDVKDYSR